MYTIKCVNPVLSVVDWARWSRFAALQTVLFHDTIRANVIKFGFFFSESLLRQRLKFLFC